MECVCEILLVMSTTNVDYLAKVGGVRDVKYV